MHGLPDFTIGGVVRLTLRIARARFLVSFTAALALVEVPKWGGPILLAPSIAAVGTAEVAGVEGHAQAFVHAFLLSAAPGLVAQLGLLIVTGMVVWAATGDAVGRPVGLSACLRAALTAFPGAVALTVLYYLCLLLGLALLVLPGLILSCMWAVVLPVYVAERPSVLSAFGRSRSLTKGHRWRIFGLTLAYGLAVGAGLGFLSGFAKGLASHDAARALAIVVEVVAALVGAATAVVSASGATAIYLQLRRTNEGALSSDLVESFT